MEIIQVDFYKVVNVIIVLRKQKSQHYTGWSKKVTRMF